VDDGELPSPGGFAGGIVDELRQSVNRGRLITYGGNVSLNFKFQSSGYAIDPWINYSYTGGALYDTSVDIGRTELRYITPHTVKGGVRIDRNSYSIVTKFRALGESTHARSDVLDPKKRQKVPGSLVFDLTARGNLPVIEGVTLMLSVANVLNRRYYTPGGPYDLNYLRSPQAPRVWNLQIGYHF
jgi:outer membrane receptor protein involved in Fe transport